MRDSVVFYRSFYEAIKELPDEQFAACVRAIMDYGLDGLEPSSAGIAKSIYLMAKPQIDANNRRYQNGTKGGRPKTTTEPRNNQTVTKRKPNDNQSLTIPEPKEKDKEKEKDNVKDNNKKTFSPPAVGDVAEYCSQNGYKISAESFVDFYESKGWMVGKNKMKDWRAAVRNWARSQRQELTAKGSKPNQFHNFEQRDTDYEKLVQQNLAKKLREDMGDYGKGN